MIVEIFRALLDLNSDLVDARFEEDFHVNIVEQTNHIFIAVPICQRVFSR